MFDFNKNKGFVITIVVALVLAVVFLVLWNMGKGACKDSSFNHQDISGTYQNLVEKHGGEPCKALVELYTTKLEAIKKGKEEMRTAVSSDELPKYTPASFKGALKDSSDYFYELTSEKGVVMDKNIGFANLISGDLLPNQSEIPKFSRQFATIKDVLKILIDNGVKEITVIDRNPGGDDEKGDESWDDEEINFDDGPTGREDKSKKEEKKKELYSAVPVLFQFKTLPEKLGKIIVGIRNENQFYRIVSIEAKTSVQIEGEASDPSDINETMSVKFVVENINF